MAVNAGTGLVFWILAARLYDRDSVGVASSLYASVAFVNYATSLGVPTAIIRYAKEGDPRWVALYTWGLAFSALTSVAGAIAYLAIVDFPGGKSAAGFGPSAIALVAATTTGVALSILVDLRLVAARRYPLVVAKNAVIGTARVALLLIPLSQSASSSVFLASVVPQGAAAVAFIAFWSLRSHIRLSLRRIPHPIGGVLQFSGVNYLASLAMGAPMYGLPVIMLIHVDPRAYATFYIAWTIGSVLFLVPSAIGQALFVEGSRGAGRLGYQAALGLGLSIGLMTAALGVATFATGLVGVVFGPSYVVSGTTLAGLMLAGIPWAIISIAVSISRVAHHLVATLAIALTLGGTIIVSGLVLIPVQGIGGAIESWFLGHLLAAGVAVVYLVTLSVKWTPRGRPSPE